jgi:hypothetical protein
MVLIAVSLTLTLARAAAADAPAWCSGKSEAVSVAGYWTKAVKEDDPLDSIPAIVACLCDHKCGSSSDDFEVHGAEVEQSRQSWSKRLEMADDDWADAAAWAVVTPSTRQSYDTPNNHDKVAWSTLDPVGQYLLINDWSQSSDVNYIADAFGAKLSESGRLAYVRSCLRSQQVVQWAMCQPDVDAFDTRRIAAELHADKDHSGFERFMARLSMDRVRAGLAKHAAEVKQAGERDPAYAKMFAIAAQTRNEWQAIWRDDAALVELALTMDDARITDSRRALAGCDDKTWPAFKTAVSAIPARQFANINTDVMTYRSSPGTQALQIVVATPKGYLASVAHYLCHSGDASKDPVVRSIGAVLTRWPGFRGPRNAAQVAIASAGLELDDRSAHIEYPSVSRTYFNGGGGGASGGGQGVIKSLKPQGDKLRIEFATVKVPEPRCVSYTYTHRLTGIDSSGRFIYESGCAKEKMEMIDHTSPPVNVSHRYADGLKPGMKIIATEQAVELSWPRAGAKVPNLVAGAPVK